jgi:hypothetical protein
MSLVQDHHEVFAWAGRFGSGSLYCPAPKYIHVRTRLACALLDFQKRACTPSRLYAIFLTGFLSSVTEEVCYYWFT